MNKSIKFNVFKTQLNRNKVTEKIKLLILIILIFAYSDIFSQWVTQSSGTSDDLNAVSFANSYTGWAAGNNGTIIATTNSGTNWNNQISGINYNLRGIRFADAMTGWAAGDNGTILKTVNGGINWKFQISGTSNILRSVFFLNSLTGWVVGDGSTVLKTTDGGNDWIFQTGVTINKLNSVYFINENTGWISGAGAIYKTTDGGNNWILLNSSTRDLMSIFFIDENTGWTTGSVYTILKSTDGGASWTNLLLNHPINNGDSPPAIFTSVYFINANTGWYTSSHSFGGTVYKSLNGGSNWGIDFPTTSNEKLYAINFSSANYGWAVGEAGTVISTSGRSITSISNNNLTDKYSLSQNYPNPFNPVTIVKFQIKDSRFVTLKIYDITGKEVEILVNEKKSPGVYAVTFDGGKLSSGVYFYKLIAGDFSETKRMIMIK